MNTRNLSLLGVAAVALIVGFFLLSNNADKTNQNPTITPSPTPSPTTSPTSGPSEKIETKVNVTKNGFAPGTLKIKAGTTVVWENKSGEVANVSSDPHPTHTLFPFLNLGNFDDGASVSAMFDKVGIYTYHNHLNALLTGTVIVE